MEDDKTVAPEYFLVMSGVLASLFISITDFTAIILFTN